MYKEVFFYFENKAKGSLDVLGTTAFSTLKNVLKRVFFFFLIGDQRFISQKGHHVHDGEHSELKLNTGTLGRDMNRKKKFKNGNTLCKTPNFSPRK